MMSEPFIPARPDPVSKAFWGYYFERSLKRTFEHCLVAGEEHLAPIMERGSSAPCPTIIVSTHGSWWDAAVTIVMSLRRYRLDADGMMEYRQLTKYRFFSRIGMFSVVREDPRSAVRSLHYAADRLRNTDRALWMFPQGTLIHQDLPVVAEPGIGILVRKLGRVRIQPLSIRYELLRNKKPTCWALFGSPFIAEWNSHSSVSEISTDVSNALNDLSSVNRQNAQAEDHSGYVSMFNSVSP
ncbi:MAG: lysophospholipid acyltransferase family protein [Ignavibacteria bacterium]|nr:lysophospholipid acyltransferase family protein [Ignavibacteria bacterium]